MKDKRACGMPIYPMPAPMPNQMIPNQMMPNMMYMPYNQTSSNSDNNIESRLRNLESRISTIENKLNGTKITNNYTDSNYYMV